MLKRGLVGKTWLANEGEGFIGKLKLAQAQCLKLELELLLGLSRLYSSHEVHVFHLFDIKTLPTV